MRDLGCLCTISAAMAGLMLIPSDVFAAPTSGLFVGMRSPVYEMRSGEDAGMSEEFRREKVVSAVAFANGLENDKSAPQGEEKIYSTDRMCLAYDYIIDNTGLASVLRYGDEGQVYFYDFFALGEDYWISASIDADGVITIPTHQELGEHPEYGMLTLEVSTFENLPNGNMASKIHRDADSYTLLLQDDGKIVSTDLDKDWMERFYPVITDESDGVFALCGAMTMTPVLDDLVTPPAAAELSDYSFVYKQDNIVFSQISQVAFDGDDVYFKGLCRFLPDAWIVGTYSEDKTHLVIKSGQYLGHGLYHYYFSAAHRESAEIEGEDRLIWVKDDEFVLDVTDGRTFTFDNDHYFTATIAGDVTYILYSGRLAEYKRKPATPSSPIISGLEWIEVDALFFTQPLTDVDGNFIEKELLSWRMYYDDVLYSFDPSVYESLESPTTEIPYGADDNWDFLFYNNIEQAVVIYETEYDNIGIESVYKVDGETRVSERSYYGIVRLDETTVGLKPVLESSVVDICGKPVDTPSHGIYIRTDKYTDGTEHTYKVFIK